MITLEMERKKERKKERHLRQMKKNEYEWYDIVNNIPLLNCTTV